MKFSNNRQFYLFDALLVLFFLVFLVAAFKHFDESLRQYVYNQNYHLIQEETSQTANNIAELISRGKSNIAFIQDMYDSHKYTKHDLIRVANFGEKKTSSFDSISYADINGTEYGVRGESTVNIGDRDYFVEARDKKKISFVPILSRLKHHVLFLFTAPIFQNDQFKGIIIGRYDKPIVNKMLSGTVLTYTAHAYLVEKKSMQVVGTSANDDDALGLPVDQLFATFDKRVGKEALSSESITRFHDSIDNQVSFTSTYSTEKGEGLISSIAVPETDLVLIKLFPVEAHQQAVADYTAFLTSYQIILILLTSVAFGIFLFIVVARRRRLQRENMDLNAVLESLMLFHTPLVELNLRSLHYRFLGNTRSGGKDITSSGPLPDLLSSLYARGLNEKDRNTVKEFITVDNLQSQLSDKDIVTIEYEVQNKKIKNESLQVICLERDDSSVAQRVLITLQDLTDVYEREAAHKRQLEKAIYIAEKANKAKTYFLANMSHDIRTPINGIMGMLHVAEQCISNQQQLSNCLSKIRISSNHLLDLINDVLDLTKAESGDVQLVHDDFNMIGLCNECADIIANVLSTRNITFIRELDMLTLPTLVGSRLHIRRVLLNILSNSVKYTPEGGKITFKIEDTTSPELHEKKLISVRFTIADTGIGMSGEFQKQLFDRFTQETQDARTDYQGTGLGMAIAKRFVDLMHGSIEVKSKKGVGTTFYVTLVLPIGTHTLQPSNENVSKITNTQCGLGKHILLVEDNEINKEVATFMLEENGYRVSVAENGEQAVNMFLSSDVSSIDAILMDIMMPIMNGYDATRAIRELNRVDAQTVPIIAMTANAFSDDIKKAKDCGMNEYVTKPIDIKYLISVLNKY